MTDKNLSQTPLRVTRRIRNFLWRFPKAMPKEVCRILDLPYKRYHNMIGVEKSRLKKFLAAKKKGRVLGPLEHRVEWGTEKRLAPALVGAVEFEALRRKPTRVQKKPFGEWYVIPNRNRMLFYRDDFVSIRVFPKSGTCRVLCSKPMDWPQLKICVENAFFKAGLDLKDCEALTEQLVVPSRSRVFKVGPVTPFEIGFYEESLGITIKADGSHPEHIEVPEKWPTWIKPQLNAIAEQTGAITKLTEQMSLHLSVMEGIDKSTQSSATATENLVKATEDLKETIEVLAESLKRLLSQR